MSRDEGETIATTPLTAPAGPEDLVLVAVVGDQATSYKLPRRGTVVIGRSRDCDVRIEDPSISRRHVELRLDPVPSVQDLGGLNGTRVRGRALTGEERVEVALGEVIDAGKIMLVLQRGGAEPRASEPAPVDAMARLHALVERIAPGTLPVLISGETGAGKETSPKRSTSVHRAPRPRSYASTAQRSPSRCSRASSSATRRPRSLAQARPSRASSRPPKAAPSFSTRSASSACRSRPSCCASSSRRRSCASVR
jgi:pSer/pThr/pTyr-binding forkhead associated (FHA) protein